MYGKIDVMLVRDWKKKNFKGGTLCEEDVTKEVSTGRGGRVISAGKSQRKKTISWHRL